MKIRVDHIKDKPYLLHVEEPVEVFPVLAGMRADGVCDFCGAVTAEITVEREFDHLRASGRVQANIELTCSRCLAEYPAAIDSTFRIILRRESARHSDIEEELELCDDDLIATVFSGDEIDLSREIEEQVAMEVPMKPLCGDGCRGLCPSCGADLNQGACDCPDEIIPTAFSALRNFKTFR